MVLPKPTLPPYDIASWQALPRGERLRLACQAWAVQGYGTPAAIYAAYVLKVLAYIGGWCFFCSFSPGLGDFGSIASWSFAPIAFQKAVVWAMAFEGLGLGCASGPLTGRYVPPFGAVFHFLRPGTTKQPFVAGSPIFGGHRRTLLDVVLYVTHYGFLFRALVAPELGPEMFLPTVILLPLLGWSDKTIFLSARAEHYYTTIVCFLFLDDWIAGAMAVQLALWLWAAVAKLNHHFPHVIAAMTSSSPLTPFSGVRKRMYRSYPDDLRPSRWAYGAAHFGTAVELCFPLLLVAGSGGLATTIGLTLMVLLHAYITANVPMAVPLEWNVNVVYGGFFLFLHHADVQVWNIQSPTLIVFLTLVLVVIPLVGHLYPSQTSFLVAMRYYAGNWPFSVWLFNKARESHRKLDTRIVKVARWVPDQLAMFYDQETVTALMGKVPAFRALHLHGRALNELIPRAVNDDEAYECVDGEMVAGMVLGWNFGDGHLHSESLLGAIQEQCEFEDGELRVICVESQPLMGSTLAWRIVDACRGELDRGTLTIDSLLKQQPWPAPKTNGHPAAESPLREGG